MLEGLSRSVRSGMIVPFVGSGGSGKSRILEHLALAELKKAGIDQVALIQLVRPNRTAFGKDRITSPAAMITFSRLWYVLRKMSRLPYQEWLETLDQQPAHHYTDAQFLSLEAHIAEAIDQKHIGAVLIDNAQHLDDVAFDWLIQLWNDCNQRFGIVLCARIQPNAEPTEALSEIWGRVSEDMRQYYMKEMVIDRVTRDVFRKTVLPKLLQDLDADYGPGISLIDRFWQRTNGNWHSIVSIATLLEEELSQDTHSPRLITADIADRVFAR